MNCDTFESEGQQMRVRETERQTDRKREKKCPDAHLRIKLLWIFLI